jgi:hypothetical protein
MQVTDEDGKLERSQSWWNQRLDLSPKFLSKTHQSFHITNPLLRVTTKESRWLKSNKHRSSLSEPPACPVPDLGPLEEYCFSNTCSWEWHWKKEQLWVQVLSVMAGNRTFPWEISKSTDKEAWFVLHKVPGQGLHGELKVWCNTLLTAIHRFSPLCFLLVVAQPTLLYSALCSVVDISR